MKHSCAHCFFRWFCSIVNISFPFLFLQQEYLRSEEEGREEVILQLLINVSAQCGVCFPCNSSLTTSTIPLVHAVRDDTLLEVFTYYIVFYFTGLLVILSSVDSKTTFIPADSLGNKKDPLFFLIQIFYSNIIYDPTIVLQIQEVWDDIRVLLRRNLLWQMSAYSPLKAEPGHIPTMSSPEQVKCLQQLFFLYPQSEALMHYQVRKNTFLLLQVYLTNPKHYFHFPASEIPVCPGSSLYLLYQPRLWDWLWQTGSRLPLCCTISNPSSCRWAQCPFKTSRTTHGLEFS